MLKLTLSSIEEPIYEKLQITFSPKSLLDKNEILKSLQVNEKEPKLVQPKFQNWLSEILIDESYMLNNLRKKADIYNSNCDFEEFLYYKSLIYFLQNNFTWLYLRAIELKRYKYYEASLACFSELSINKPQEIYFLHEIRNINMLINSKKPNTEIETKIKALKKAKELHNIEKLDKAYDLMVDNSFDKALVIFEELLIENPQDIQSVLYKILCLLALKKDENLYLCYSKIINHFNIQEVRKRVVLEFIGALVFFQRNEYALCWINIFSKVKSFFSESELLLQKFYVNLTAKKLAAANDLLQTLHIISPDAIKSDIKKALNSVFNPKLLVKPEEAKDLSQGKFSFLSLIDNPENNKNKQKRDKKEFQEDYNKDSDREDGM